MKSFHQSHSKIAMRISRIYAPLISIISWDSPEQHKMADQSKSQINSANNDRQLEAMDLNENDKFTPEKLIKQSNLRDKLLRLNLYWF